MIAIIISIVALIISLTLSIRLFLLDKDYCEFAINDQGSNNTGLIGNIFSRKLGYTLTLLRPKIQLLKSDIYDVKITGINKDDILPLKKDKIVKLKADDIIEFNYMYSETKVVEISYSDSKNNLYKQKLTITPFYNGGSASKSTLLPTSITNRKWSFINSFKPKYF